MALIRTEKQMTIAEGLSKSELLSILKNIEASRSCCDKGQLQKVILKAKELFCADYAICGLGRANNGKLLDVLMIVNGNYSNRWVDVYEAEKLYYTDPVVKQHIRFCITQFWSDTFKVYNDKISKEFLCRAGEFGLRYGISSGVYNPESEHTSIFSFASDKDRFHNRHKKIADIITVHLHKALVRTFEMSSLHPFSKCKLSN